VPGSGDSRNPCPHEACTASSWAGRASQGWREVNRGEHESIPAELMKWVWAAGKKLPGLIHRRGREGTAYFSNYESGKNNKSSDYQIN
jgi:GH24 family phage-related lysozyme (muramidase)